MSVISGSLPRHFVTRAFKAVDAATERLVESGLGANESAVFTFSDDAIDFMLEEGIISQRDAINLAATMLSMHNKQEGMNEPRRYI